MSVMQSIRSVLGRRRDVRVYVDDGAHGIAGVPARQIYRTQPHLRTVVDFLARNVAQLPLKCYVRASDTDRRRDTTSALAQLIANPNPQMTRYDLVAATVSELCLYDRFIWFVGRDASSASGWQVRLIPHDWVTGWGGADGWGYDWLEFSDPSSGAAAVRVPSSQLVMCHGYAPGDPASGTSPIETLKHVIDEQTQAQRFRTQAWRRGMRITGYVSRPTDAAQWSDSAFSRFTKELKENWRGDGEGAGGTPLLEDGMAYHPVEVTTKEKDWASGVRLSREDVAAAYHVNPSIIWPGDGQTYASAKDNARALYADTLGPLLVQLQERINKDLLPIVGADSREYVEFDIQAKVRGSFEETAASLQASVGGPWMTRDEARAFMNMPSVPGGSELIVPMNVTEGGQASPRNTSPNRPTYSAPAPQAQAGKSAVPLRHKAAASEDEQGDYQATLRAFFGRQRRSVLSAMGAPGKAAKADGDPAWWDSERWNRELAKDLAPVVKASSNEEARRTLDDLGIDPDEYDPDRAEDFLDELTAARARMINDATRRKLEDSDPDSAGEVFDEAETTRAARLAATLATTVAAWSACEAGRQRAPSRATKTWVTGQNPRRSHAAMNGDTVHLYEKFSNGADWPGDSSALDAADVANCNCTVEITIP